MTETATQSTPSVKITGPRGAPLIGVLPEASRDMIGCAIAAWRAHGDVFQMPLGPLRIFFLAHPDDIQHVLRTRPEIYTKDGYENLRKLIGEGLVSSDGALWKRQRRLLQPLFTRSTIGRYVDEMRAQAQSMLDRWEARCDRGETISLFDEMQHLTLSVLTETIFSWSIGERASELTGALGGLMEAANVLLFLPSFVRKLPTKSNRRANAAIKMIDGELYGRIRARRASAEKPDDLLTKLIEVRDEETGEGIPDKLIRDELVTFFIAGQETTASALTWTLGLLSLHPLVRARVEEELDRVLGGRVPTHEDLEALTYTTCVLRESMRLFPPAWAFLRQAMEEDTLPTGRTLPAGAHVFVSPYLAHHHPEFWENPEGFDPERFLPERHRTQHKFAYFPFGGGKRTCIGLHFAMVEAVIALSMICSRYRLSLVPGSRLIPLSLATIRPLEPLHTTVTRR